MILFQLIDPSVLTNNLPVYTAIAASYLLLDRRAREHEKAEGKRLSAIEAKLDAMRSAELEGIHKGLKLVAKKLNIELPVEEG